MKRLLWVGILILALSMVLVGCGRSAAPNAFAGTWTTNIGTVNFAQNDNEITGNMEGYGGFWNENFTGTLNEDGEAVFSTVWLGDFTLVLNGDDTFRTKSSDLSFCGIRGTQELPAGCGFSGKWIIPSKSVFLDGSYMILKQVGANVSGDLYNGNDEPYDSFSGAVEWGKGWRANGTTTERGEISLWMNAAETGFQFMGSGGNSQELCAAREGIDSAYLSSFYCEP